MLLKFQNCLSQRNAEKINLPIWSKLFFSLSSSNRDKLKNACLMRLNRGFSEKSGRKRIATDGKFIFVAFQIHICLSKNEIVILHLLVVR